MVNTTLGILVTVAMAMTGCSTPEVDSPVAELAEIDSLIFAGRYQDAEAIGRRCLDRITAEDESSSNDMAEILDRLVECLYRGGKRQDDETWALAERAVSLRTEMARPADPALARSLDHLAALHQERLDWAEAQALYERALTIRQERFGEDHPESASSYHKIGTLLAEKGDLEGARPYLNRALTIRRDALGPDDPTVASTLRSLAVIHHSAGDYEAARTLYRQSLEIQLRVLPPNHPDLARGYHNLGTACHLLGDYDEARTLYERALAIRTELLGPEHPNVSWTITALATLLHATGDYDEARVLYRRALVVQERLYETHPLYLHTLTSFAELLQEIGDLEEARRLHERALQIRRSALGESHADVANSLSNLGYILHLQGDYQGAHAYLEEAIHIQEAARGPDHPSLIPTLVVHGSVLAASGDPMAADKTLRRAHTLAQRTLGPQHPVMAWILEEQAASAEAAGAWEECEERYRQALDLTEVAPGAYEPLRISVLYGLTRALTNLGRSKAALATALQGQRLAQNHLGLVSSTMPERQALIYSAQLRENLDRTLSILSGLDHGDARTVAEVWSAVIGFRGLILDEMAARQRMRDPDDQELSRLVTELRSARQALADAVVRGGVDGQDYGQLLDAHERERERAEEALAAHSHVFRTARSRLRISLDDVVRGLPQRTALVAYVQFDRHEMVLDPNVTPDPAPTYAAFVLAPSQPPRWVDLGDATAIDAQVAAWRRELVLPVHQSDAEAEASCREAGEALRASSWDPVALHLHGADRVLVVPDGALNLVNLAALPTSPDRYLVDDGMVIHLLSTERDVVVGAHPSQPASGLLALGGPDFDARAPDRSSNPMVDVEVTPVRATMGVSARTVSTVARGNGSEGGPYSSMTFSPLPATVEELREIESIWREARPEEAGDTVCLKGNGATETAFKRLAPGRRQIHIATHGFFVTGSQVRGRPGRRGVGFLEMGTEASVTIPSPLLRSGLALAGANHCASAPAGEEDGILTAEEIAALDLTGVEWTVLSACDTGVGEVRIGEGVFGLRRAFLIAGVETIVMSLWQVEDAAARKWMRVLYENRLRGRQDTASAVRTASLSVLNERRSQGASTHPFFWAMFVATGSWR